MNFFSKPAVIEIKLNDEEHREKVDNGSKAHPSYREFVPLYGEEESVSGEVLIMKKSDAFTSHKGMSVRFVGAIERIAHEGVIDRTEFVSLTEEICGPGNANALVKHTFNFKNVDKKYESYMGENVRLRYFVEVTVNMHYGQTIVETRDIWVYKYQELQLARPDKVITAGIANQMVIDLKFLKNEYSLSDSVVGKITVKQLLVRIQSMTVQLVRQESIGIGDKAVTAGGYPICNLEIVEGNPAVGEIIPIRFHLEGLDLTPTMSDIHNKFSVRTILSFLIIDEMNRKYYKRIELVIRRTPPE